MADENERRFNEGLKTIVKKLQPEYESIKKLKNSDALSIEREQQILDTKSRGLPANFQEQARAEQEIERYNSKVEGIAIALQALSRSYGVSTFITRRFRAEYLV